MPFSLYYTKHYFGIYCATDIFKMPVHSKLHYTFVSIDFLKRNESHSKFHFLLQYLFLRKCNKTHAWTLENYGIRLGDSKQLCCCGDMQTIHVIMDSHRDKNTLRLNIDWCLCTKYYCLFPLIFYLWAENLILLKKEL